MGILEDGSSKKNQFKLVLSSVEWSQFHTPTLPKGVRKREKSFGTPITNRMMSKNTTFYIFFFTS